MSLNLSTIPGELLENQLIQALVEENKSLKALLAKWQPEISIEFNSIDGTYLANIEQNGFAANYILDKDTVLATDSHDKVEYLTDALISDIFRTMIRDQITPRVEALEANRVQLQNVGKW